MQLMDQPSKATGDLDELRADSNLRGLDRDRFVDRLAHHDDQVNYVHLFREGNGRTQHVFWNRVARDAGWQLDRRGVDESTNDQACRAASGQRDFGPLREIFDQIVTKAILPAERDAARRTAERACLSFPTPATCATQPRTDSPSSGPQARSEHRPAEAAGPPGRGSGDEQRRRLRAGEHP